MSALDDHNRQHTYGQSLGAPTSVVGVSAQQAIDNQRRLMDDAAPSGGVAVAPLGARPLFKGALIAAVIAALAIAAAYAVGGIGAVAMGLIAFVAGGFAVVLLIGALVQLAKGQRS